MLQVIDTVLYALHFAVLAFALTGWRMEALRRLHRWVLSGIALCWFGIGPLIGETGFCPLTWLQWNVRAAMGYEKVEGSYINDLLAQVGMGFNAQLVDIAASSAFVVLMALAALQWKIEADNNVRV